MDQRAYINLEVKKNDRTYYFQMPFGSTYQECYDVAIEMANEIIQISRKANEAADKLKSENSVQEMVSNQESSLAEEV